MGANNIITVTTDSVKSDLDQLYCEESHKYILFKRYIVGTGTDIKKVRLLSKLATLLGHCDDLIEFDKNELKRMIKRLMY